MRSPYTSAMRKRESFLWLLTMLLLVAFNTSAQTSPSPQQQIELHRKQAQVYLGENKLDLAIGEFKAIIAIALKNVDARGNLGVILFFQGSYADAIPQLRAALKLQATLWKIQALLAIADTPPRATRTAPAPSKTPFPHIK